jgi:hypothetical protein
MVERKSRRTSLVILNYEQSGRRRTAPAHMINGGQRRIVRNLNDIRHWAYDITTAWKRPPNPTFGSLGYLNPSPGAGLALLSDVTVF